MTTDSKKLDFIYRVLKREEDMRLLTEELERKKRCCDCSPHQKVPHWNYGEDVCSYRGLPFVAWSPDTRSDQQEKP